MDLVSSEDRSRGTDTTDKNELHHGRFITRAYGYRSRDTSNEGKGAGLHADSTMKGHGKGKTVTGSSRRCFNIIQIVFCNRRRLFLSESL